MQCYQGNCSRHSISQVCIISGGRHYCIHSIDAELRTGTPWASD